MSGWLDERLAAPSPDLLRLTGLLSTAARAVMVLARSGLCDALIAL